MEQKQTIQRNHVVNEIVGILQTYTNVRSPKQRFGHMNEDKHRIPDRREEPLDATTPQTGNTGSESDTSAYVLDAMVVASGSKKRITGK